MLCIFITNDLAAQYCDYPSHFIVPYSTISNHIYPKYLEDVPDEKGVLRDYSINIRKPIDAGIAIIPLRPHIMGVHGFITGGEKIISYNYGLILANNLTRYGYGTSSIEFRSYIDGAFLGFLSGGLCQEEIVEEAVKTFYRSISDTRSAINYLFDNSQELGIDTTNFFVTGNSLGGTAILQAVLVEDEQEWLQEFPQFADIILNDPNLTPWPPYVVRPNKNVLNTLTLM